MINSSIPAISTAIGITNGIQKRKQRCWDTEPVFANMKHNHGFKRFILRSIKKVNVEMGLVALAHKLRKKIA